MSSTQTINVALTRKDQAANPYYYVPVDVPEGTTRIDVRIAYPKAADCIIDIGMLDPRVSDYPSDHGFRGWSGGARDRFFVATDDATPGYVHGEMPAGKWQVILGLYKVPESGTNVTLDITLDDAVRPLVPQPARTFPVRAGAGWYKGDLHCHTFHSDARGAPEILHTAAKQAGLDFLAVADHNTITQRRYFHPNSSPDLVFVRAMEVTTAIGHANVFGVDDWIDFRMTKPGDEHRLAEAVRRRGGLLSINHDKPTIPWDYELPQADCMEVWQQAWLAWNWISLERWQKRLVDGLKLSAVGGSDYHQPEALQPEGPLTLARPTTVLWLDELSEDAILAAMKAGRGYITESPSGPHLSLVVDGKPMGSTLRASEARLAEVHIRGAAGDLLHLIDATGEVADVTIETDDWVAELPVSSGVSRFIRAEIVAKASHERIFREFGAQFVGRPLPERLAGGDIASQPIRRALSNPIYLD